VDFTHTFTHIEKNNFRTHLNKGYNNLEKFVLLLFISDFSWYNAYKRERKMKEKTRCPWAGDIDIYIDYHDNEWGRPVHDDRLLFEMLILEGAQAGLSWITILKKREAYKKAFDNFDAYKIAKYDDAKTAELLANEGIVRNRLKINAAIVNAKLFLELAKKHGSFDKFIWSYVNYKPMTGNWKRMADLPATSEVSDKISSDLKEMGFKFVGSTIIYSFMQAVGMVNDHLADCFVYEELQKEQ